MGLLRRSERLEPRTVDLRGGGDQEATTRETRGPEPRSWHGPAATLEAGGEWEGRGLPSHRGGGDRPSGDRGGCNGSLKISRKLPVHPLGGPVQSATKVTDGAGSAVAGSIPTEIPREEGHSPSSPSWPWSPRSPRAPAAAPAPAQPAYSAPSTTYAPSQPAPSRTAPAAPRPRAAAAAAVPAAAARAAPDCPTGRPPARRRLSSPGTDSASAVLRTAAGGVGPSFSWDTRRRRDLERPVPHPVVSGRSPPRLGDEDPARRAEAARTLTRLGDAARFGAPRARGGARRSRSSWCGPWRRRRSAGRANRRPRWRSARWSACSRTPWRRFGSGPSTALGRMPVAARDALSSVERRVEDEDQAVRGAAARATARLRAAPPTDA